MICTYVSLHQARGSAEQHVFKVLSTTESTCDDAPTEIRQGRPHKLCPLTVPSMRAAESLFAADEEILSLLQFSHAVSSAKPSSQAVSATSQSSQPQRRCMVELPAAIQSGSSQNDEPHRAPLAKAQAGFRAPRRAFCPPRIQQSGPDDREVKRVKADVHGPSPRILPSSFKASAERHAANSRWENAVARPGSAAAEKENAGQATQQTSTPACALELHFSAGQSPPERRVRVQDRFEGGASEYARVWKAAVQEEMNLRCLDIPFNTCHRLPLPIHQTLLNGCRLEELARRFHTLYTQHHNSSSRSASGTAGANTGGQGQAVAPQGLQQAMRRAGMPYYAECELSLFQKRPAAGQDAPSGEPAIFLGALRGSDSGLHAIQQQTC
jgi:hypothetical protein